MANFKIFKSARNNQFYFRLQASGNYKNILSSEGYKTLASCKNGIDSVRKNSSTDSKYKRLGSADGKYYFTLEARNGELIGVSETYETSRARDAGIALVKQQAAYATVKEA